MAHKTRAGVSSSKLTHEACRSVPWQLKRLNMETTEYDVALQRML